MINKDDDDDDYYYSIPYELMCVAFKFQLSVNHTKCLTNYLKKNQKCITQLIHWYYSYQPYMVRVSSSL